MSWVVKGRGLVVRVNVIEVITFITNYAVTL